MGMALTVYPVGVERQFIARHHAAERAVTMLRFLAASEQSESPGATGYKGFYYHFLDMQTARRVWQCELSSIDTALLIAGALTAAQYFDGQSVHEAEIRTLARLLYERVDWAWMLDGGDTLRHGWRPEGGFPAVSLERLRRGADPLPAGPRLADAPDRAALLRGLVQHVPVEGDLRHRLPLCGAALHPPDVADLVRLSAASATATCARATATTSRTAAARR
jgi:hypothetical protein